MNAQCLAERRRGGLGGERRAESGEGEEAQIITVYPVRTDATPYVLAEIGQPGAKANQSRDARRESNNGTHGRGTSRDLGSLSWAGLVLRGLGGLGGLGSPGSRA